MVVDFVVDALLQIGDDAAGHSAGHLAHQHFVALGGLDDDGAALVLDAGLGQPGGHVVAVVVVHQPDASVHGDPVGVHVQRTHEDGHLEPAVVEIFGLVHLLDDHDLAVGRSNDDACGVLLELADGTTVEVNRQRIDQTRRHGKDNDGDVR